MTSRLWYRAAVGDDEIDVLRQGFVHAVNAAGAPDGACLFLMRDDTAVPRESDGIERPALHGNAVFFSPVSVAVVQRLLVAYAARPSPPPERRGAELLVGRPEDWDMLPRATH